VGIEKTNRESFVITLGHQMLCEKGLSFRERCFECFEMLGILFRFFFNVLGRKYLNIPIYSLQETHKINFIQTNTRCLGGKLSTFVATNLTF